MFDKKFRALYISGRTVFLGSLALSDDGSGAVALGTGVDIRNANGGIPSGSVMLFRQTNAPVGFTKVVTHDNAALRVTSGTVGTGGSIDFSQAFSSQSVNGTVGGTALTIAQMPSHNHGGSTGSSGAHNGHSGAVNGAGHQGSGWYNGGTNSGLAQSAPNHTHSISSQGSGDSHDHSFSGTSIDLGVRYVDIIIATKD